MLEGADGDLWRRLALVLPDTRWTPAHLQLPVALDRGVRPEDWAGNYIADIVAKAAVTERAPPPALVAARHTEIAALDAVHKVLAVFQQKHIENARAAGIKRKPADRRRRGLLRCSLRPRVRPKRVAPVAPTAPTACPPGAHDVELIHGPFQALPDGRRVPAAIV